eukprot:bmy_22457T0
MAHDQAAMLCVQYSGHDGAVSTVRFLGRTLKVWSVRRTELALRLGKDTFPKPV